MHLRTRLGAGRYLVVPTTFSPGQEAEFLLRVFTHSAATSTHQPRLWLLDRWTDILFITNITLHLHRDTPRRRWWGCGPRPAHLTRLTLVSCQLGGGGGGNRGGAELYLTVKCEGETHRSGRVSSSGDTVVWDFSVVLYRSHSSLYCNG